VALTKGIGFANVRAFVTERHGESAWSTVVESLEPEEQQVLQSIVPVGWYDLALYAKLIRRVDAQLGGGNLHLVLALGRFEAERDLTTIHQFFLKFFRTSYAVEQTPKYWSRFHDTGVWTMRVEGDRALTGSLADWGVVDAALCRELVGYLARTLELVGARDVRLDHPQCRARGAARCEFKARWLHKTDAAAAGRRPDAP
jgi:predicted hydrocarbon binding protein